MTYRLTGRDGDLPKDVLESKLFSDACKLYKKQCDQMGHVYQQPSESASYVEGIEYVLRNSSVELARFTITVEAAKTFVG